MTTKNSHQVLPGRYDLRGVSDFPVASPPPSENIRTAIGAVTDPSNPKKRQQVAINRATDILENEHARGRISERAYHYGRELQGVFEKGMGTPGRWTSSFEPAPGGDRASAHQHMIASKFAHAKAAKEAFEDLAYDVGQLGAHFLRRILTGESDFAIEAGALANERRIAVQAGRFRFYLEQLAERRLAEQTAVGRARAAG